MVQGDKYNIPITIKTKDYTGSVETTITPSDISSLRIQFGVIEDVYPNGGITYDSTNSKWLLPITQAQSLEMRNAMLQVRLVYSSGDIFNSEPTAYKITPAIIREAEG